MRITYIFLILLLINCASHKEKDMQKTTINWQKFYEVSSIENPRKQIIKDYKSWHIAFKPKTQPKIENLNFNQENIVLIGFGTRSSGGYFFSVKECNVKKDTLWVELVTPYRDPLSPVTMQVTQPLLIFSIPKIKAKHIQYNLTTLPNE